MNLHGIVRGAINAVNPDIPIVILRSTGSTENASGRTIPTYADPQSARGQKQPVTGRDIERFNQQNIQGVTCKMYVYGNIEALIRQDEKGGDLIKFEGQTYLVASVMERWPDWCCVALTMQITNEEI